MLYIVARDEITAQDKAASMGISDHNAWRVVQRARDLDGAEGHVVFAEHWRDAFTGAETPGNLVTTIHAAAARGGLSFEIV